MQRLLFCLGDDNLSYKIGANVRRLITPRQMLLLTVPLLFMPPNRYKYGHSHSLVIWAARVATGFTMLAHTGRCFDGIAVHRLALRVRVELKQNT